MWKASFTRSRVCQYSQSMLHAACLCQQCGQLNYNVDFNTKCSNYMKIQFKALNYFELQDTSK